MNIIDQSDKLDENEQNSSTSKVFKESRSLQGIFEKSGSDRFKKHSDLFRDENYNDDM